VRSWLEHPVRAADEQVVNDLRNLAVDDLVEGVHSDAFRSLYSASDSAEDEGAAHQSVEFRTWILGAMDQDPEPLKEVLKETLRWWLGHRRCGASEDLGELVKRCADQLAAALVFKNLPRPHPVPDNVPGALWYRLVRRVAEQVVVRPIWHQQDTPALEVPEEWVEECVSTILGMVGRFEYRGLGEAISYFGKSFNRRREPMAEGGATDWPEEAIVATSESDEEDVD
jgi:hypothetical protein